MKKFYSLLLMATALLIGMNLQATVRTAGTFAELKAAINEAANGDEIQLTADIDFGTVAYGDRLNVTKSITIDGQNYTLKGAGQRQNGNSNYATIWVNIGGSEVVNVTFKDLTIVNERTTGAYNNKGIETRGNIGTLTFNNVSITANSVPLQVGGSQASNAIVNMTDCKLKALTYYCILSYNPYTLTANNCEFKGWNALYFKGVDGSAGSRGAVATLTDCNLNCPNIHDTPTNAFAMFVCEDDGISITLNNCGMHAEQLGNQTQTVLMLSNFASKTRRSTPVSLTVTGDNSYINGKLVSYSGWAAGWYNNAPSDAAIPDPCPLSITISGGTYAFNPALQGWLKNSTYETEEELYDESNIGLVTIPDGYEVSELTTNQKGKETTLYRVRKTITTAYNINDNVEEQGDGQNANTEFKITADDEIAENIDEVVANYVEVSNNATLTVGEGKTLEVTNGLDVKEGAQVVVEPGATVIVGEGGVVAETTEGVVIESSETEPASFLLDPEVIVNTTPLLTVKMIANVGKDGEDWYWHRFAMPVNGITSWTKQNEAGTEITVPTYLQGWDYGKQDWDARTVDQMVPFLGYTLTYDQVDGVATTGETKVVYVFKGNLVGNIKIELNFQNKGYNYFGNSYTAFIDAKTLLADVMNDPTIGGAVYMWDAENQGYSAVTMRDLRDFPDRLEDFEKEVAPMQTFILQLRSDNKPSVFVDYKNAIWGNPRYGKVASAPARMVADNDTYAKITVTAENGKTDAVRLNENAQFSDEYENGMDADKFINSNNVNIYATVNGNNYSTVATDNLEGKMISLQTKKGSHYTLSFSHISGTEYAVKDMLTGIVTPMTADNTYEFVAGENTLNENRFMIIRRANMPTDAETVEATAARKGIYTIMGQYVGETDMFNTLPAGIYVVDGVKVVR